MEAWREGKLRGDVSKSVLVLSDSKKKGEWTDRHIDVHIWRRISVVGCRIVEARLGKGEDVVVVVVVVSDCSNSSFERLREGRGRRREVSD